MALVIALVRLILSLIFLVAGITKLTDQKGTREAVMNFGAPRAAAPSIAVVLPLLELAIAIGLLFSATAWLSALAALLVLGLFVVAISINLAQGKTHECHCFGQIYSRPLGWSTLVRNILFALVAGVVIWNGPESQPPLVSTISRAVAELSTWQLVILIVGIMAAAGFLLQRLRGTAAEQSPEQPTGLPIGSPAPDFELPEYEGGRTSLVQLLALRKPVLLIFTNPTCGPCISLFKEISDWQTAHNDQLTIAVISFGTIKDNFVNVARNRLGRVLLQEEKAISQMYGARVTPTAVMIGTDGRILTDVAAGGEEIRTLLKSHVENAVTAPEQAPATGATAETGIHPTPVV
ncbi:MAG TPA: MauE/DoxX family redox-associated membrane protein [Pyrinomonadaceae bacterium]|nr:MauE/DoxX family redox-associated membrane protein [Pyrinomonadaceae bacterium]